MTRSQVSTDAEITEMMREESNIQLHMRPIIVEVYDRFLLECVGIEEREYSEPEKEIEARLIHRNYVSQKDIVSASDLVSSSMRLTRSTTICANCTTRWWPGMEWTMSAARHPRSPSSR